METLTVTLQNEHARRLLEELQALGVLTIRDTSAVHSATGPALPPEQRTFNAVSVSTKGFKFNREEANER
jgi:hypothetical protein